MSNVPNDPNLQELTPSAPLEVLPVAVIAIHGVGQHSVGASAEAVSTLLLNIVREDKTKNPHEAPPYSGFAVNSVDVPLHPVLTPNGESREAPSIPSKIWNMFDERRGFLRERKKEVRSNARYVEAEKKLEELDR